MDVLMVLLIAGAAGCFGLATVVVPARVNLVAAGLLLWVLTELIPRLQRM